MESTLIELSDITKAIIAVRDLPAALAELHGLEEKHAAAVESRISAEKALETVTRWETEAHSALGAHEMKLDATYKFLPNYKGVDTREVLTDLNERQRRVIAVIESAAQDAAAQDAAAQDAAKAALAKDTETDNISLPSPAAALNMDNGLPPAVVVVQNDTVCLAIRNTIRTAWTANRDFSSEVLSKYSLEDINKYYEEHMIDTINARTECLLRDNSKKCDEFRMYAHPFSLMGLLYRDQGKYYHNMLDGYTSVFSYHVINRTYGNELFVYHELLGTCYFRLSRYSRHCTIDIYCGSESHKFQVPHQIAFELVVPIRIGSSYMIA